MQGFAAIVQNLISFGAGVTATDYISVTPLHLACGRRYFSTDADNDRDYEMTAVMLIAIESYANAINSVNESLLYLACFNNATKMTCLLLEMGGNLSTSSCDDVDKCPLRICCQNGNVDMVKLLLDKNFSLVGIHRLQLREGIDSNH